MEKWLAALVVGALLVPALGGAETYYRYETDSGSIAFTDERERIPTRYRESVTDVPASSLFDYAHTTLSESGASAVAPPKELPTGAALEPGEVGLQGELPERLALEIGDGVSLSIPTDPSERITVTRDVLRWEDGLLRRYTIIKRGDRIIAEIGSQGLE